MNIERNVEISFEPFFQVQEIYQPQKDYKVCRSVPTQSEIRKIKFPWKLDVYPYSMVEAEVIENL